MRPVDKILAQKIEAAILLYQKTTPMPGIRHPAELQCLTGQIVDSIRRIKYVTTIASKPMSPFYSDVTSRFFDPLKGAVYHMQQGNIDEAFWLVFLATHFGKNKKTGWSLIQEMYRGNGRNRFWNWDRTSNDFPAYQAWLAQNRMRLKAIGSFSNHRKYLSLSATSSAGTGAAIGSYIDWIVKNNGHAGLIKNMVKAVGHSPTDGFDYLYNSMTVVASFGRIGKFDYLTMIGKLGLANIEPGITYLHGATGPLTGAKLLFGNAPIKTLEDQMMRLGNHLNLPFVMQVVEDAVCNWQKSPNAYVYFNG